MSRPRTYPTAADRQRAYRARLATRQIAPAPAKPRKLPSRPARLMALESSLRALQMEYQAWLDSLPEALEGSVQAERLGETIEQLDAIAELLGEVQPPLGFGRD